MKKQHLLSLICFFLLSHSFGQQNVNLVIEFKKDDHSLRANEQTKLVSILDSLSDFNLERIEITGHTDSDGSDAYNIVLSQRRNQSVVDFLTAHNVSTEIIQTQYFGEKQPKATNTNKTGQQRNRRVELSIAYSLPLIKTVVEEPVKPKEDCTQDTMITFPKGTVIKINKCAYLRNPNCIKINEFLDAESMRQENLETMTEDGQSLVSAGMVKYDICDGVTVTCYIPVSSQCPTEDMDRWERNVDGTWKKTSKKPIPTELINGTRYYAMALSGLGFTNLDKLPPRINLNRIKIKVKKGIELNRATISCGCPLYGTTGFPKNKRKRKIILGTLCCPEPLISVSANTKSGEVLVIQYVPLNMLKKATNRGYCRTTIRKSWWIFKVWDKQMYRKYKLKREDFQPAP